MTGALENRAGIFITAAAVGVLLLGVTPDLARSEQADPLDDVLHHQTSQIEGEALFEIYCATCHGTGARGTDDGPSLLDSRYGPEKTGDIAFLEAVTNGVSMRNYCHGDMPAVEAITAVEAAKITIYIRSLQRAETSD